MRNWRIHKMKPKDALAFTVVMICFCSVSAGYDVPEQWRYPDLELPGRTAKLFAPGLIRHLAHSSPTFTVDGKTMFWSVVGENGGPRKILFAQYGNGEWSEQRVASFSGRYHDDQPFISYDGTKLYFASKRPPEEGGTEKLRIWVTGRLGHRWGKPVPVGESIGFWTPTVTRSGTLYFLGMIEGYESKGYTRSEGIFRSEAINGKYMEAELLPEIINQRNSLDWCPYISADESYLIFSSDRDGGYGSGDLYITFRNKRGQWSQPVNLGQKINTDKQERFPGVSPDGKYLFFTRWYGPPNYHDLYWISADIINDMRNKIR